jgi:hypothetical protein
MILQTSYPVNNNLNLTRFNDTTFFGDTLESLASLVRYKHVLEEEFEENSYAPGLEMLEKFTNDTCNYVSVLVKLSFLLSHRY